MTTFVTSPSQLPEWSCDTLTEDGMLVCAPERPPPRMRFGSCPSPYRLSNADAFADINRALDVKSLRDSVRRGPYAGQLPPRMRHSVHLGPSPLSSPPLERSSAHIISPSSLSVTQPERPKSFVGSIWRTKVDEHEEKPLLTRGHATSKKQTSRSICKGIKALAGIVKGLGKHKEVFVHDKLASRKARPMSRIFL